MPEEIKYPSFIDEELMDKAAEAINHSWNVLADNFAKKLNPEWSTNGTGVDDVKAFLARLEITRG